MEYDWRCIECNEITTVDVPAKEYKTSPEKCTNCKSTCLTRVIIKAPAVPFETLKDRGIFERTY